MNIQIFAFTESPDMEALLEVECRELTGQRPVIHHSLDELKGMAELFQVIDVLIIDEPEGPKDCHDLLSFIGQYESRFVKILLLGEKITSKGKMKTYRRIEIADLFEDLKTFVHPQGLELEGWSAIPLSTLIHFQNLPFDLYVRISNERFVKRVPAFEALDADVLESYQKRGVQDLFCEKKYSRDFSMMLITNMINRVEQEYGSSEEKLEANNEVFLTVREIIQTLGLSSRVVEVCESTIDRITVDVMTKKDQFSGYLTALKNNPKLAFHYKLVELTSFICAQLVHGMKLPDQAEEVRKLVFASFFCDMTLSKPNFIHFRRAEQVEHMTLEDDNEINFHALRASELVATYRNTPREVSLIIRQHHGSLSGVGFPKQKSQDLLPLSKILLIAQDLAYDILVDRDGSVLDVLKSFVSKHQHSGFHDLLSVLEGNVGKNLREMA